VRLLPSDREIHPKKKKIGNQFWGKKMKSISLLKKIKKKTGGLHGGLSRDAP
jgi:hypothetical protein